MNVSQFLEQLESVRQRGEGYRAKCPAHDGKSRDTLSVREAKGRILIYCFAGCSLEAICAALQIKVSSLFAESAIPRKLEPTIVRHARRAASESLSRNLPASVRQQPITVIYSDEAHVDDAIARALALCVEGELVQVALEGTPQ